MELKGIPASPGIEIGQVFVLKKQAICIRQGTFLESETKRELESLETALEKTRESIRTLQDSRKTGEMERQILDAQLMMLEDEEFRTMIRNKIVEEQIFADTSVFQVMEYYIRMLESLDDAYMRERSADIRDVCERIIKQMQGIQDVHLDECPPDTILIAEDLTPSETAQMDKEKVKGFAIDTGGKTSHAAIIAKNLGIPAVMGLEKISQICQNGEKIILDGGTGTVLLRPSPEELEEYEKKREAFRKHKRMLEQMVGLPAETRDQAHRVILSANIAKPQDAEAAIAQGAQGCGLFRTEFLYMETSHMPSEEDQFRAYKKAAEAFHPHGVIIRTMDIGGDKELPYLDLPKEENPFLGLRAIRLCFQYPEIFRVQLRAILRASAYGKVRIMYPMISGLGEVRQANRMLEQAKAELKAEGIPFDAQLEVGIMVEIPSAAICAEQLIQELDFFCIGTNDLIQYTLAADRLNPHVSSLYEPFHPAVLRLIQQVIDASHAAGKWTGMCGEMAGSMSAAPILLGMGLDEFSMSPGAIPYVKDVIRSMTWEEAQNLAKQALSKDKAEDVYRMLQEREAKI